MKALRDPAERHTWLVTIALGLVFALGYWKCSHDRNAAWDAAVARAGALAAPYETGVKPHAPLLGDAVPGEAVARYRNTDSEQLRTYDPEETQWHELMLLDELPANLDARLRPLLPLLEELAAGAACDRIDPRVILEGLGLRSGSSKAAESQRPIVLIGFGPLGAVAMTAARVDLAAGRSDAALQRTAALLTLARDQFAIGASIYEMMATTNVGAVSGMWNDDRLRALPTATQRTFATVLQRFDEAVLPASSSLLEPCFFAKQLGVIDRRSLFEGADLDAYLDALAKLPADSAPWPVREPALEAAERKLPDVLGSNLVEVERGRRQAIAHVRLMRIALALHLGEPKPMVLEDPFTNAPFEVSERDGATVFTSKGLESVPTKDGQRNDKPIERVVKKR